MVSGHEQADPLDEKRIPQWSSGVLFVGDDGMLLSDYGKHVLLPEEQFADFERPEPFIPKSMGHHAEWIHACKTGDSTTCNFQYAGWLTEANHLGNVAYRTGKKLEWEPVSMSARQCTGSRSLYPARVSQGLATGLEPIPNRCSARVGVRRGSVFGEGRCSARVGVRRGSPTPPECVAAVARSGDRPQRFGIGS